MKNVRLEMSREREWLVKGTAIVETFRQMPKSMTKIFWRRAGTFRALRGYISKCPVQHPMKMEKERVLPPQSILRR
jgi:hypothetical protein